MDELYIGYLFKRIFSDYEDVYEHGIISYKEYVNYVYTNEKENIYERTSKDSVSDKYES